MKEQEALQNFKIKDARMQEDGAKKIKYLYVSDAVFKVGVSGNFETQLNEKLGRPMFSKLHTITSEIEASKGTWEQTKYQASLIDGGRTYEVYIEGMYDLNNLQNEKAFTIQFSVDENGRIY